MPVRKRRVRHAGTTADEIRRNGALLTKLIDAVRSETEAKVKKEVARTGAPGGRQDHDGDGGEMSSRDFFKSMMIQCPLSRSP